ncbi:MAG: hypothetical protein ACR2IN_03900, partial [Thermoleophilaceae bacterium]
MADQTTTEEAERPRSENSSHGSEKRDSADRAEVSNYEIVQHHFRAAAERLDLPEDVTTVMGTSYR